MGNHSRLISQKKTVSKLIKLPVILAVIFLSILVAGCNLDSVETSKSTEGITEDKEEFSANEESNGSTIAITNVRVFEGDKLSDPKTIVIEDGLISSRTTGDIIVDGNGGTLLPGFIDAHIHLSSEVGEEELEQMAEWGVTTVFDMGSDPEAINSLRELPELPGILSNMGEPLTKSDDAIKMVDDQVDLGADYIKIFLEDGPEAPSLQEVVNLVEAAHHHNKLVIAHVTSIDNVQIAIDAGVDVLTHTPFAPLPESLVKDIAEKEVIIIPTIAMMKGVKNVMVPDDPSIDHVLTTVQNANKAGIPVIVGTDANTVEPGSPSPFGVEHGLGFHEELELMVEAGLTPLEVIQSATITPAKLFGLEDRGVIEVGRRADLILVEGDPTVDIKAVEAIKGVWIEGVQVK